MIGIGIGNTILIFKSQSSDMNHLKGELGVSRPPSELSKGILEFGCGVRICMWIVSRSKGYHRYLYPSPIETLILLYQVMMY